MVPDTNDDKNDQGNMHIFEGLVEGMAEDRICLNCNRDECDNGLGGISVMSSN